MSLLQSEQPLSPDSAGQHLPQGATVYVDAVADLYHAGHAKLFCRVKQIADAVDGRLVVGIHSDVDTATYKRVPICTMEERLVCVHACRYVDAVLPSAPLRVTRAFMQEHGIDVVIHAHSHAEHEDIVHMHYADVPPDRMFRVERTPHISTTDLLERVWHRKDVEDVQNMQNMQDVQDAAASDDTISAAASDNAVPAAASDDTISVVVR